MIKDNQRNFNRLHVVLDGVVVSFSYFLAWVLRFKTSIFPDPEGGRLTFASYMQYLLIIVPAYLIIFYGCGLYTSKRVQGRRLEFANIIRANIFGILGLMLFLYVTKQMHVARLLLGIFFVICVIMVTIQRNLIRNILRKLRKKGFNQKHLLLIGYSRGAEEYIDRVISNPQWGYTIRGILDDHVQSGTTYRGVKVIGRVANLPVILEANTLDEIAITLGLEEYMNLEEIVSMCEKSGVHTQFVPDYSNIIPTKPYIEDLMGLPVVNIRYVPLSNNFNAMVKRMMDIIGSILCIILFSPIMLFAIIMIKCTSPGPLIYKQIRVGLHNKEFEMFKFRSMDVQKPEDEKKAWTVKNDPRVTKFGKLMRKLSIDELPQFFNVLAGNMSLVGPRPERPHFVEKFREEIPRYMVKHQVRPGMTGWAQVNGLRGDTSIRKRIDYDLYYIENWTVGLDFKILFMTIFRFTSKNAY